MFGGAPTFSALYWGFDETNLFLRLDPDPEAQPPDRIRVTLLGPLGPSRLEFPVVKDGVPRPVRRNGDEVGRAVLLKILEVEIPMGPLGIRQGDELVMSVEALSGEVELERIPRSGYLPLSVPGAEFERIHWRV
jgi:hypothetical protein